MNTNNQNNSLISYLEDVALLNKNSVEIITKLNDIVASQTSSVNVKHIDTNGVETQYSLPTVSYLKTQIDQANNNIQRLSDFTNKSTYLIDGNSTKKLYQIDLNKEPEQISNINNITAFTPVNNWFFENLINPLLTVQIDLSDKIDDEVTKVLCRRYVVSFLKNESGYTVAGQNSLNEFISKFMNRNDIQISEFLTWYNSPTNLGVYGGNNPNLQEYDESEFNLSYNQLEDYGIFSILKQELDELNSKLWYHFNTLTYSNINGISKILTVGDYLILNKKNSTTKYLIHDINTAASNYRVLLERVEGLDPVPTGTNVLKYYSTVSLSKKVKVSIGFDEYNIIFLKPINGLNNVISNLWSKGCCFYTNNLTLDADSKTDMSTYYLNTVYNYGEAVKELVSKTIPSTIAIKPNAPVLIDNNFKVSQINAHLTDSTDTKGLKDLQSQKTQTKSQIDQINTSLQLKNKEIQNTSYKTIAERTKAENELTNLNTQLNNATTLLNSITTQITSATNSTVEPKYRVRGFWNMPLAQSIKGYSDQEVIQFKIQYRYSSKTGTDNTTEGYTITNNNGNNTTGYFSNWTSYTTDKRIRTYDSVSQTWIWQIEDVSSADTPNINQLDIAIQSGEKVEVRIKSISEASYPDYESDWSNILTVTFPDELTSISTTQTILEEAKKDALISNFETTLTTKGVTQHISDQITDNSVFYGHTDKTILSSFNDSNLNALSLFKYLTILTDKISALEEIVSKSQGELSISVFNNTTEYKINNDSTLNLSVNCENFGVKLSGGTRLYDNKIYLIGDYYIKIYNSAFSNSLGLLSNRVYQKIDSNSTISSVKTNTFYQTNVLAPLIHSDNTLYTQKNNQFIWFSDYDNGVPIYNSGISFVENKYTLDALSDSTTNAGLNPLDYTDATNSQYAFDLIKNVNWYNYNNSEFLTNVVANINSISTISKDGSINYVAPNDTIIIPINIYFKFSGNSINTIDLSNNLTNNNSTNQQHKKKLKLFLETTNSSRPFEFTVEFTINKTA